MKNARRIMNILAGNYTSKSKISVGYKGKDIERVEGDTWEEAGKMWTIKNGIKRTISKMSSLRKLSQTPLSCPKCETTIRHWQDERSYMLSGKCYTCQLKREHKLRINDTYDDFIKMKRESNIKGWMKDAEVEFKSHLENIDNKSYITENGQIEDWNTNIDKKELSNKFNKKINNIKKQLKDDDERIFQKNDE